MKKFDVVLIDPPHEYYGDPNKMGAAGKEYSLMSPEDVGALDIRGLLKSNGIVFCWATCPKLDVAIQYFKDWGIHFRGVAYVWVKTTQDGKIINGQGVRPTYTKPTTELLLYGTVKPKGRPLPIFNEGQQQVVLAPRGRHSEKPAIFHELIEENLRPFGYQTLNCVELFARSNRPNWVCLGNEMTGKDIREDIKQLDQFVLDDDGA